MKHKKPCTGYREEKYTCEYGFNQNHIGICAGYVSDNEKSNMTQCQEIELCGRLFNRTGGVPVPADY